MIIITLFLTIKLLLLIAFIILLLFYYYLLFYYFNINIIIIVEIYKKYIYPSHTYNNYYSVSYY